MARARSGTSGAFLTPPVYGKQSTMIISAAGCVPRYGSRRGAAVLPDGALTPWDWAEEIAHMDAKGLETLLVVTLIAALAPVVCAALPRLRIPQVAFCTQLAIYYAQLSNAHIRRGLASWLGGVRTEQMLPAAPH